MNLFNILFNVKNTIVGIVDIYSTSIFYALYIVVMRDNRDKIVAIYNPPGMEDYDVYKALQEAPIALEINMKVLSLMTSF